MKAKVATPERERALLQEWFDSVSFDKESVGVPKLDPEEDDEDDEEEGEEESKSLEVKRRKRGLPKTQKCKYCSDQATKRIIHAEGMAYISVCDSAGCMEKGKRAAEHSTPDGSRDPSNIVGIRDIKGLVRTPGGRLGDPSSRDSSPRSNWVEQEGGMPRYMRMVRNALLREGHSMSRATALAVAAMKRWARGGDDVSPKVQAAAARALAQWEKMKAKH